MPRVRETQRVQRRCPTSAAAEAPLTSKSVDSGGPFGLGDFPDDFGVEEPDHEPISRGWLPPEDRLWRHPSEVGASAAFAGPSQARPGLRWGAVAAGALSVAAVTTLAVVMTGGSRLPVHATDTSVAIGPDVVKVVDAVSGSLVALVPDQVSGAHATGVVLPGGQLVVTAAAAVEDGEHLTVVSSTGKRMRATVTGVDDTAGVAVVQLPQRLSAGSFVDKSVVPQQLAVAACRCGSGAAAGKTPDWALGMIRTEGMNTVDSGGPALIDAIEAEVPLGGSALGTVLLDDGGAVIGILDGERTVAGDTVGYFVPTSLAVAVADELAHSQSVARGWLGVVCRDDHGAGAAVTSVVPGSPAAAAGIAPGDVVEAVGSHEVSSLADLQARLYVTPPGTVVELTVLRAGTVGTMQVTVAARPS